MHVAESQVKSEKASRYLVQLCKHFAHKVPTDYDETTGRVDFQPGLCLMEVGGGRLRLRCEAQSELALHRVKTVVEVHLVRFARDEEIALIWRDAAALGHNPGAAS